MCRPNSSARRTLWLFHLSWQYKICSRNELWSCVLWSLYISVLWNLSKEWRYEIRGGMYFRRDSDIWRCPYLRYPNIYLSFITGPLATPVCPYCRQRMTVLLPFFSDAERNAADMDADTIQERQQLCDNIRAYNRLFSGQYQIRQISSFPNKGTEPLWKALPTIKLYNC